MQEKLNHFISPEKVKSMYCITIWVRVQETYISNCLFEWDANKSMLGVTENCFTIF